MTGEKTHLLDGSAPVSGGLLGRYTNNGVVGGFVSGSHPKKVGLELVPVDTKSASDSGIAGNAWWDVDRTWAIRAWVVTIDVPFGQLWSVSAEPSAAKMVSSPRALTNRGPRGMFSRPRPPSTS